MYTMFIVRFCIPRVSETTFPEERGGQGKEKEKARSNLHLPDTLESGRY